MAQVAHAVLTLAHKVALLLLNVRRLLALDIRLRLGVARVRLNRRF